ncbi:DddA-like double-stranded DNA deaminase toxin [Kribbella aluminosa]|uniref:DddA-like double-stranded DNA deaminase toxin n=1 Tax=Kribbella aluminosa TaxID=416017 RepID=UPI003387C440
MPSELQKAARGLVDCLNEVPGVAAHLQRTAARCRENADIALQISGGGASMAAQQLYAAAQKCEEAAHYLSLAPFKAKGWAERLIGTQLGGTSQPDSGSAGRNPLTTGGPGAGGDRSAGRGVPDRSGPGRQGGGRPNGVTGGSQPDGGLSGEAGRGSGGSGPKVELKGDLPARHADWAEIDLKLFKKLPVRTKRGDPTDGILIGNGQPEDITSGRGGPGAGGPGLIGDYRRMNSALDHVEGHVAAILRRAGASKDVTLYINNRPCVRHEVACVE